MDGVEVGGVNSVVNKSSDCWTQRPGPHPTKSVGRRTHGLTRPSTVIAERLTSPQYAATLSALVNMVVARDSVLGAAGKSLVKTGMTSTQMIPLMGAGTTELGMAGKATFSSVWKRLLDVGARARKRRRGRRIATLPRNNT